MLDKPFSVYAERNGGPILDVLKIEFAQATGVLEIGSGTGQHAARFAADLPWLHWQTSDREVNHPAINAWVDDAGLSNLQHPLVLDVLTAKPPVGNYDAVFSANTAHIMSLDAVSAMFDLIGQTLSANGVFCLYGPFSEGGEFNAVSNASFDRNLRAEDPAMGIRDIELLDDFAGREGLKRHSTYAMPANNQIIIWKKPAP